MNNDAVKVNRIDFREATPSIRLFEVLGLALSIQCLIPATIGVLAVAAIDGLLPVLDPTYSEISFQTIGGVARPLQMLVRDFHKLVVLGFSNDLRFFLRLGLLLAVIGFTGIAVSRSAGLQFCASRRNGAVRSLRHAARFWRPLLISTALLCLLLTFAVCGFWLVLKISQLMNNNGSLNAFWGTPAWLTSFGLVVGGCCLAAGWLLSLSAIGVDSCDGPESLSRGISYVLARFQRLGCYVALLAVMLGTSSIAAAHLLAFAGRLVNQTNSHDLNAITVGSPGFVFFQNVALQSWLLSLTFCGCTVVYTLLRKIEDGVELRAIDTGESINR